MEDPSKDGKQEDKLRGQRHDRRTVIPQTMLRIADARDGLRTVWCLLHRNFEEVLCLVEQVAPVARGRLSE